MPPDASTLQGVTDELREASRGHITSLRGVESKSLLQDPVLIRSDVEQGLKRGAVEILPEDADVSIDGAEKPLVLPEPDAEGDAVFESVLNTGMPPDVPTNEWDKDFQSPKEKIKSKIMAAGSRVEEWRKSGDISEETEKLLHDDLVDLSVRVSQAIGRGEDAEGFSQEVEALGTNDWKSRFIPRKGVADAAVPPVPVVPNPEEALPEAFENILQKLGEPYIVQAGDGSVGSIVERKLLGIEKFTKLEPRQQNLILDPLRESIAHMSTAEFRAMGVKNDPNRISAGDTLMLGNIFNRAELQKFLQTRP